MTIQPISGGGSMNFVSAMCGAEAAGGAAGGPNVGGALGKAAKDMAAFMIIDSFLEAMQGRHDKQGAAPMQIYQLGNKGGQQTIDTLVQTAIAASTMSILA